MAVRINVTAVQRCSPDEVRAVMSEVIRPACPGPDCQPVGDLLQLHEHNGWVWFNTSVWGVSAGDLNRGLCKLARPAVQFTTSDGDRWYLTVHGGPQGQVHFLHEFGFHRHVPDPAEDAERQAELDHREEPPPVDPELAFLEDDRPPESDRPRIPFDLIADSLKGMGAHIPEDFSASVAHLPYSAAVNRYREWHAGQVSAALTAAGIPHDPAALRKVLLWENLREREFDHDLGNLPRLLHVLGLGGEWDEWVQNAEAPPEPEREAVCDVPAEEPPPEPVDLFTPVLSIVGPLGVTPVEGGPVPVKVKDIGLVRFFVDALSIHQIAGTVLDVTVPSGPDRDNLPAPSGEGNGQVEMTAGGFRVGLPNHLWFGRRDMTSQLGKPLATALYHLPDGSMLDVRFAQEGYPHLSQHYRGPVVGGDWYIEETYPALTRTALEGGLAVARHYFRDRSSHKLRDETEAEAIVELAKRDPLLWDMPVERRGRSIRCESDIVGHLSKVIFRHRYAGFWDVAGHDREAVRQMDELVAMRQKMRRAGAEAARKRAAPHDPDVLLDGRHGRYWRSDFTLLTDLEQDTREKVDTAMASLDFRHVGDLVAKKQRDIVLRTYAHEDRLVYGILMGKRTMYLGYEFFTRFADGTTLTTTTNGAVDSHPEVGIYYKTCPGLEAAALYAKHRWGIGRFRTHRGTEPVILAGTLVGVAEELDAAFVRRARVPEDDE